MQHVGRKITPKMTLHRIGLLPGKSSVAAQARIGGKIGGLKLLKI